MVTVAYKEQKTYPDTLRVVTRTINVASDTVREVVAEAVVPADTLRVIDIKVIIDMVTRIVVNRALQNVVTLVREDGLNVVTQRAIDVTLKGEVG